MSIGKVGASWMEESLSQFNQTTSDDEIEEIGHAGENTETVPEGEKATTSFNISKAGDRLPKCILCLIRKVPFIPATFCQICVKIWFLTGEEAKRMSASVWHEGKQLTVLELEKLHWNINNHLAATAIPLFYTHLKKEKKEEAVKQLEELAIRRHWSLNYNR